MPLDVNIDDTNTTLIQYQGSWTYIAGSTRQWEGGIHTTGQAGSSAKFNFRGFQVWVHGTIPAGSGTNVITVAIDGDASSPISRTSNGSAVYDEVYFASASLRDTDHTIIVTNLGSTSSGNSEFMLDRFEFQTNDDTPSFAAFPPPLAPPVSSSSSSGTTTSHVSPSSSSTFSTSSALSSSRLSLDPSSTIRSSLVSFPLPTLVGRPTPTGVSSSSSPPRMPGYWIGIIAAIVSCSLVVILILLIVIWRKQRRLNLPKDATLGPSIIPTPFPVASEEPASDHRSVPNLLLEKGAHQGSGQPQPGVQPANTPTNIPLSPSSNADLLPLPSNSTSSLLVKPYPTDIMKENEVPPPSYYCQ